MDRQNDKNTPVDNLLIGRQLQFIQHNTTAKSPANTNVSGGLSRGKLILLLVGVVVVILLAFLIVLLIKAAQGETGLVTDFFVFFGLIVATTPPTMIFIYVLTKGVEYTNTLDVFAEHNKALIAVRSDKFRGVIGQLILSFSKEESAAVTTRNDRENLSWGAATLNGRHVSVGRCYTTGPYAGFAHVSVQLTTSQFPHIIIDADANNHNFTATNLARILGKDHQYELEGNFPDYFKVFAANIEIARLAYYVLTPDIMQLLIQRMPTFDIEIIDNTLHLYWQDVALVSELNPDWAGYLPRVYQLLEEVIVPIVQRIEQYGHIEELGAAAQARLETNTAMLADVGRQVIYGEVNNLTTTANKNALKATGIILLASAGTFVLFILGVVVWAIIASLTK